MPASCHGFGAERALSKKFNKPSIAGVLESWIEYLTLSRLPALTTLAAIKSSFKRAMRTVLAIIPFRPAPPFLRVIIGHAVLGDHLHVAPDILGQHHDLEEGIVVFKLADTKETSVQAFALGFTDQVLDICALVVFGNHLVGWAGQARAEDPVGVVVVFKQHALLGLM